MRMKLTLSLLFVVLLVAGCATPAVGPDTFGFFDDDNDGVITMEEFNEEVDRFDTTLTFDDLDTNNDSVLNETEFEAFEDDIGATFAGPTDSFAFFDDDDDLFLDETEFDEDIGRFDNELFFDDVVGDFDTDFDGFLDDEEFGLFEDDFGPFDTDFGF